MKTKYTDGPTTLSAHLELQLILKKQNKGHVVRKREKSPRKNLSAEMITGGRTKRICCENDIEVVGHWITSTKKKGDLEVKRK